MIARSVTVTGKLFVKYEYDDRFDMVEDACARLRAVDLQDLAEVIAACTAEHSERLTSADLLERLTEVASSA